MTQKEKVARIRELAMQSNISERYKELIQTHKTKTVLYFYGKCKTTADIEAVCNRMTETLEKNWEIMAGVGVDIDEFKVK